MISKYQWIAFNCTAETCVTAPPGYKPLLHNVNVSNTVGLTGLVNYLVYAHSSSPLCGLRLCLRDKSSSLFFPLPSPLHWHACNQQSLYILCVFKSPLPMSFRSGCFFLSLSFSPPPPPPFLRFPISMGCPGLCPIILVFIKIAAITWQVDCRARKGCGAASSIRGRHL